MSIHEKRTARHAAHISLATYRRTRANLLCETSSKAKQLTDCNASMKPASMATWAERATPITAFRISLYWGSWNGVSITLGGPGVDSHESGARHAETLGPRQPSPSHRNRKRTSTHLPHVLCSQLPPDGRQPSIWHQLHYPAAPTDVDPLRPWRMGKASPTATLGRTV